MGTNNTVNHPVIFFDGVCNLCNASIQFIIRRDPNSKFRFAALQSKYAENKLDHDLTIAKNLQTLVLVDGDRVMTKSTAALNIAKNLSGVWPLLYAFIILPPFIRHFFYDLIAKNRYKLFGKKEECMIPTPELKALFLD